jgi:pimeloyl-ACP methyl ester carboxylesterase
MGVLMHKQKSHGIGYMTGRWPLDPKKSTLFFIHGAGGSSLFWKEQIDDLSLRANTLAIDLPGHGRSSGEGMVTVEDYAQAVANFIKNVHVPHPILCGVSLGGAIVQQLLLDYPNLAKAGILISTGSKLKVAPVIFETIGKNFSGYVDMICKLAASKKTDPSLIVPFKEDTARGQPEVTHGDFRACNRFDVTDHIASIEVPVLVVTAEDDKLTPPKFGEFLEKSIKNASRAHIIDAGHIAPMENPKVVNRAIISFLDQNGL